MKAIAVIVFTLVGLAASEFCHSSSDCYMENCPSGYVLQCVGNPKVCSCERPGDCSVSSDCEAHHGRCENDDKHWYCNENTCCCGKPCHHAVEHYVCSSTSDCSEQFYQCTNGDKTWYCTDSHCHCGSHNGH